MLSWASLCRHLSPSDVRVPLQQHFGPQDLIHLLYSCSVARSPQAGGGRAPRSGFIDSPPPLGFGTLFLCSVISIGKGGLEFSLRQGD